MLKILLEISLLKWYNTKNTETTHVAPRVRKSDYGTGLLACVFFVHKKGELLCQEINFKEWFLRLSQS